MTPKASLHEQVSANLLNMEALPHFAADRLWLTFYLCGPPDRLRFVAEALAGEGWQNTENWEGAFLYPKVRAERNVSAIMDVARSVQSLCETHTVDMLHIDVDTSPDVTRSQFVTLYHSDS
jgi:ferredoxin-NADP reductase